MKPNTQSQKKEWKDHAHIKPCNRKRMARFSKGFIIKQR